jgi:tetratricopeptide (TPR) repeat protein
MTAETSKDRLDHLLRHLKQDPSNVRLLADAADAAIEARDPGKALDLSARALSLRPGEPSFVYRKGCAELLAGELDDAESTLRGLAAADPGASAVRVMLAQALLLKGRYPEAKTELAAVLAGAHTVPEAPALYLRALHHLGEVEEGIAFGEQILAKNPGDAELLALLSTLYVDSGDMKKAEAVAQRSMAAGADMPEALTTLGTVALGEQRGDEASARFAKALERNPRSGRAWVGQGLARMFALDLEGAESSLSRGVENMPSHVGSWHALAWCQMLKKDYTGAEASFTKSLDLDRNFSESHGGLAVLAAMRGDATKAKPLVERALRLDAQSFSGRFAQSLLLRESKPETAERLVQTLVASIKFPDGRPMVSALAQRHRRR